VEIRDASALVTGAGRGIGRAIALALAREGARLTVVSRSADELEEKLFRPVQLAYGRARRTYAEFAARHGLPIRDFEPPPPGLPSTGAKAFIDRAVVAVGRADHTLSELQDSLLPVDVGDAELRAALADLRTLVGDNAKQARDIVRTVGR